MLTESVVLEREGSETYRTNVYVYSVPVASVPTAVMVVHPYAMVVTTPFASMVATDVSELLQEMLEKRSPL